MSDNRSALLLVMLSVTLLAAGDAVVRLLGESLHVGQVIAYRGVLLMIMLAVGLMLTGHRLRRETVLNKWSLIRGLAETVTPYTFLISLQFLRVVRASTQRAGWPLSLACRGDGLFRGDYYLKSFRRCFPLGDDPACCHGYCPCGA